MFWTGHRVRSSIGSFVSAVEWLAGCLGDAFTMHLMTIDDPVSHLRWCSCIAGDLMPIFKPTRSIIDYAVDRVAGGFDMRQYVDDESTQPSGVVGDVSTTLSVEFPRCDHVRIKPPRSREQRTRRLSVNGSTLLETGVSRIRTRTSRSGSRTNVVSLKYAHDGRVRDAHTDLLHSPWIRRLPQAGLWWRDG